MHAKAFKFIQKTCTCHQQFWKWYKMHEHLSFKFIQKTSKSYPKYWNKYKMDVIISKVFKFMQKTWTYFANDARGKSKLSKYILWKAFNMRLQIWGCVKVLRLATCFKTFRIVDLPKPPRAFRRDTHRICDFFRR